MLKKQAAFPLCQTSSGMTAMQWSLGVSRVFFKTIKILQTLPKLILRIASYFQEGKFGVNLIWPPFKTPSGTAMMTKWEVNTLPFQQRTMLLSPSKTTSVALWPSRTVMLEFLLKKVTNRWQPLVTSCSVPSNASSSVLCLAEILSIEYAVSNSISCETRDMKELFFKAPSFKILMASQTEIFSYFFMSSIAFQYAQVWAST